MPDIRADIDPEGPRPALYVSDHDLFAFIRHTQRTINEPGNPDGHVGNVRDKMALWQAEIIRYMDESASEDEAKIASAKRRMIAATKERGIRRAVRRAVNRPVPARCWRQATKPRNLTWNRVSPCAIPHGVRGSPFSQAQPYADKRTDIDRAAGRLLEAF